MWRVALNAEFGTEQITHYAMGDACCANFRMTYLEVHTLTVVIPAQYSSPPLSLHYIAPIQSPWKIPEAETNSQILSFQVEHKRKWLLRKLLHVNLLSSSFLWSISSQLILIWKLQVRARGSSATAGLYFSTTASFWRNHSVFFLSAYFLRHTEIKLNFNIHNLHDKVGVMIWWLLLIFSRLYINYQCPFAQRAWITRNYKVRIYC